MQTLTDIQLKAPFEKIHAGKVRDTFMYDNQRILVVSDRQSAFDIAVGAVPYKGQVLNQISKWWFDKTADIVPNQVVAVPDVNVMIVKNAKMFPVEVIVRGYITGSTSTSAWTNYAQGIRDFCGVQFPDGLVKNQKLEKPVITPTTKPEVGHDEPISPKEIIEQGLVNATQWAKIEEYAMALYKRGAEIAAERGLIFVDTKYEFGEDEEGNIIVCDEVNTPDSSRYWIAESYEERFAAGQEPQSLDKEFLRLYLRDNGFNESNIDQVPKAIFAELSEKYIALYEQITGEKFVKADENTNITARIEENLKKYFGI